MSGRARLLVVALGLAGPFVPSSVGAATFTLSSDRDNTLYQSSTGELSNGFGGYLFAGNNANGERRRGLVHFDLASLPPGSVITSATLRLTMSQTNAGANTVSLHRALASWGEGTSDAGGTPPQGGGSGALATTNDATWIHRLHTSSLWATPGGDFAPTPSATLSVGSDGSYTWSAAGLVDDVRAWLADPATNHGWVIVGNETTIRTAKRFDTRENPDAQLRPLLTLEFESPPSARAVPLPGAAIVALGVLLGLVGARGRRFER